MTDTANPIAATLDAIKEHGWKCNHPDKRHTMTGIDGTQRRCVWIEGILFGVLRDAYLAEDGTVMLIGEMRDVDFATFLSWLGMKEEPKAKAAAVDTRQKSLFGDEE